MVLNVLRSKKIAKRVMLGILILIIPAFLLWGVGSLTRREPPVGTIDGRAVTVEDLASSRAGLKAQLIFTYYGNFDALNQILNNRPMLNYMAWERLVFLNAARKKKIKVQNKDVMDFILRHPLFRRGGAFDRQVYEYVLRNNLSMEPRQFEELVRENLQVRTFRQGLYGDLSVTDDEALAFFGQANDKVRFSYIMVGKDTGPVAVSDKEAKDLFNARRDAFMTPAKADVEYIELPYNDTTDKTTVIRQLEKLYPVLRETPADMLEIAKASGLRHGRTGPFTREDVVSGIKFFKGFGDTAFSLGDGEISAPIFSAPEKGAAYVLRKVGTVPSRQQTFAEARETIIPLIEEQKRVSAARKAADELCYSINTSGASLEEAASSAGKEIKTVGPMNYNGYIENVGAAKDIIAAARKAEAGTVIDPVTVKNGVVVVRVEEVIPGDAAAFEKDKALLKQRLLSRKRMNAVEEWFKENGARIKLSRQLDNL